MTTVRYVFAYLPSSGSDKVFQKETSFSPYQEIKDGFFTLTSRFAFFNSYFICGHEIAPPSVYISAPPAGLKLHYVTKGKGTYNGHPFGPNSMFVTRPNFGKELIGDHDEPWEMFWCVWHGELAKNISSELTRYEDNTIYYLDERIQLQNMFRYMIYNYHNKKKCEKTVIAFSEMLLSECQPIDPYHNPHKTQHSEKIQQIQNFISKNFRTTSVEEIAQTLHYNWRYLSSIYHNETGSTIQNAIKDAKLHCAENYLLEKQLSMEEIALASGYSNYSAFIKAFKKKYNMTPSEFVQFYSKQ